MRVSDYIADKLVEFGITQVFCVTGGGAMHLNDSLANHPRLNTVFNHHEQACAIAAEGYFRSLGKDRLRQRDNGPRRSEYAHRGHGPMDGFDPRRLYLRASQIRNDCWSVRRPVYPTGG